MIFYELSFYLSNEIPDDKATTRLFPYKPINFDNFAR
jgi:hypothetical protein